MKICLINPTFPLSLWDFSGCADLSGSAFPFLPLSLPTLAALTPREHEVRLIDENVSSAPEFVDAELIGITGYWVQRERVFALADRFRAQGKTVVIGGPLVQHETIAECEAHADAVFMGEAEYTWPQYLGDLKAGKPLKRYLQEKFVSMDDSPAPRFDLLDLPAYSSGIIETSRGCPHDCEFCEIPTRLGKVPRVKPVSHVMAEIRSLVELGVDTIFIIDDNFIGNRVRARQILEELAAFVAGEGKGIFFSCQVTIDVAKDAKTLELLRRANIRRVFTGLETPRKESLLAMRKGQNTTVDLLDAVKTIQSYGIVVWAGFIVGLDQDGPETFDEQFRFIQEAAIPVAMVGLLQAIPGTPLYDRIVREGRLRPHAYGGILSDADSLYGTNIEPRLLPYAELVEGFRALVARLYSPEAFADRLLRAVRRGAGAPVEGHAATRKELLALARTLRYYLLTVDHRRRSFFLKTLAAVRRDAPSALGAVLMHLVTYKHLGLFYADTAAAAAPPLSRLPASAAAARP